MLLLAVHFKWDPCSMQKNIGWFPSHRTPGRKSLNSRIVDLEIHAGVWWWGYATAGVSLGEKGFLTFWSWKPVKQKQRGNVYNHLTCSCDLFPETAKIEPSHEKLAAQLAKLRFLRMAGRAIWVQLMRWNSSTWQPAWLSDSSVYKKSRNLCIPRVFFVWLAISNCWMSFLLQTLSADVMEKSWWTCEGHRRTIWWWWIPPYLAIILFWDSRSSGWRILRWQRTQNAECWHANWKVMLQKMWMLEQIWFHFRIRN